MKKNDYRVVGLMSGTSLDGVDLVFTEINFKDKVEFTILASETISYSEGWREKLSTAIHLEATALNELDHEYTSFLAHLISTFIDKHKIDLLDAICSHGHTVKHKPRQGITLQIGNLPELSKLLGIPVICDFRVQDVELGGQGAPLVPIGDRLLFKDYKFCINLGGFANISLENGSERIAFDICPLNTVCNYFMQKLGREYDEDGKIARSGTLNVELLSSLNDLSYYKKKPPKSLGIEWVNSHIIPMLESSQVEIPSILHTFCVHAAEQIAASLDNDPGSTVLLTGGGAYNGFFVEQLRSKSACDFVLPPADIIDFKEALIFALLGVLRLRDEVNVLSSVTGAKMDHSSGRIYEP